MLGFTVNKLTTEISHTVTHRNITSGEHTVGVGVATWVARGFPEVAVVLFTTINDKYTV